MYKVDGTVTRATSKGVLSKAWYLGVVPGRRVLVKGCSEGHYEPYSEVVASAIALAMGIPHIEYWLAPSDLFPQIGCKLPHVSVCLESKPFGGYRRISAWNLYRLLYHKDIADWWNDYTKLPITLTRTCDMLLFDAVIGNTDRHFNNWDFYFKPENGKPVVKYAEVFDNGAGLLSQVPDHVLQVVKTEYDFAKPFCDKHKEQLQFIKRVYPQYRTQLNPDIVWTNIQRIAFPHIDKMPVDRQALVKQYVHDRLFYYVNMMK